MKASSMPLIAAGLLLGLLGLPAGATAPVPQPANQAATAPTGAQSFNEWVTTTLVDKVKADPHYKRIPLDTQPAAEEFKGWMEALWLQRITPDEFKRDVERKYPGHDYEADFIIAALPPVPQRGHD